MTKLLDLTGNKFGRLLVLRRDLAKSSDTKWVCACDCGNEKSVFAYNLRSGHAKSCGCYARERGAALNKTHGLSKTKEHRSWTSMVRRCTDKKWPPFQSYGAKGIRVCDEWMKFAGFIADMGLAPSKTHTIERIDNSLGYNKNNCRWADKTEQSRNRGVVRMTIDKANIVQTLRVQKVKAVEISRRLDLPIHCVTDVLRGRSFKESRCNAAPDGVM